MLFWPLQPALAFAVKEAIKTLIWKYRKGASNICPGSAIHTHMHISPAQWWRHLKSDFPFVTDKLLKMSVKYSGPKILNLLLEAKALL